MKRLFIIISLALVMLSPSFAAADGPSIGVGGRTLVQVNTDRSQDPVSISDSFMLSGLYVDVEPIRDLLASAGRLRLGIEWQYNNSYADLFGVLGGNLSGHHLLGTIDYGYELTPWLALYGRGSFGVAFYDLTIEADANLEADDYGLFSGYAGGGVEFLVPYTFWGGEPNDDTLGARLEAGHTFRADPSFTVTRSHTTPEDAEDMPLIGAELGDIDVNGWYVGLDFFGRF